MDDDHGAWPRPSVLRAWAVTDPLRLEGGQGLSFSAGGLVLKPAGDVTLAVWLAEVLDEVSADDVRVIRPVPSRSGQWVDDGWSAWQWLEGEHRSDAWDEVFEVSARFHRDVAAVRWSPAVVASHRWAVADRVAWGEADADLPALVEPLLARQRPVDLSCQLVHGDLGGNVLFADSQPPAVIDVSPYWRPAGYADAIIVTDAVAWAGADHNLVERLLFVQTSDVAAAWGRGDRPAAQRVITAGAKAALIVGTVVAVALVVLTGPLVTSAASEQVGQGANAYLGVLFSAALVVPMLIGTYVFGSVLNDGLAVPRSGP